MATEAPIAPGVGRLLRQWRRRRHLSQLELALEAGVSTRHISFVETGRSRPSRGMVMSLAGSLEVPLRERNELLLSAGFAPEYRELAYEDPQLEPVRDAIGQVLDAHDPLPALVVDRHWELVAANRGLGLLTADVAAHLLEPPANALRIALHPEGMPRRMLNHGEWRGHILHRLERQLRQTGDPAIESLLAELSGYPCEDPEPVDPPGHDVFVSLRLRAEEGAELSFFGTVATFGTAVDLTVAELSIESFFPADAATAAAIHAAAPR